MAVGGIVVEPQTGSAAIVTAAGRDAHRQLDAQDVVARAEARRAHLAEDDCVEDSTDASARSKKTGVE